MSVLADPVDVALWELGFEGLAHLPESRYCLALSNKGPCLWPRSFMYSDNIYEIVAGWHISLQLGWALRTVTVPDVWLTLLTRNLLFARHCSRHWWIQADRRVLWPHRIFTVIDNTGWYIYWFCDQWKQIVLNIEMALSCLHFKKSPLQRIRDCFSLDQHLGLGMVWWKLTSVSSDLPIPHLTSSETKQQGPRELFHHQSRTERDRALCMGSSLQYRTLSPRFGLTCVILSL